MFDDLNRETAEKWMSGSTVLNTIATAYNADGEVTSTGDSFSDYAFGYNGQGDVTSVDNSGTPGVPHVVLSSDYNAQGERTSLAATIAGTADFINSYSYDALSRLRQIDQQGQTGGNAVADKSIYLGLDAIGNITGIYRSNFVGAGPTETGPGYSELSYDSTTGLLSEINDLHTGSSIDDLTFTYDSLGRISTFGSIDGTATYGYDPTSQLVSATYTTATGGHQPSDVSFSWDANGNNDASGVTVSSNNRVTNDGTFTYAFDHNGNRISRQRDSGATADDYLVTYSWDYRNRLTDVNFYNNSDVLTKHVHYVYDVFDNLIGDDIDSTGSGSYDTTEAFVLDVVPKLPSAGNAPLETFDASWNLSPSLPADTLLEFINGDLAYRFLSGPSPSGADAVYAQGAVSSLGTDDVVNWLFVNNQGSPTDIVNSSGTLVNHIVYSAFGQDVYESDPTLTHLQGYAGGTADPNTGLVKFGERWYDPQARLWISVDPAGFRAGDANFRRYVGNDPTDSLDASGLVDWGNANWEEIWTGLWNPYDAYQAKAAADEAEQLAEKAAADLGCGGTAHNGPQDALRHAIWNALMAQRIGADEAKKFADAHEANSTIPEESAMDEWNNALGRAIGAANPDATPDEIVALVMQAYEDCELRVLRQTGSGPVPPGTPVQPSGSGCAAGKGRPDPGIPYNGAPGNPYPVKPHPYPRVHGHSHEVGY